MGDRQTCELFLQFQHEVEENAMLSMLIISTENICTVVFYETIMNMMNVNDYIQSYASQF